MTKKWMTDPQGRKVTFAKSDKVRKNSEWVRKVLLMLGHPEAMVTNKSQVFDFDKNPAVIERASGIRATSTSFIWKLAEKMRNNKGKRFKDLLLRSDPPFVMIKLFSPSVFEVEGNRLSPKTRALLRNYYKAYERLTVLPARPAKGWSLVVTKDGGVSGRLKGDKDSYAMEFRPWQNLLGMPVKSELPLEKTVAALISEATTFGYTETTSGTKSRATMGLLRRRLKEVKAQRRKGQ